jgi:CO/xanthine dehydrogenase FAD-binding subunit
MIAATGPDARYLAGGTDLVVGLRDDNIQPGTVIDLKEVADLDAEIGFDGERMTFGALSVMSDIETDAAVLRDLTALAEAAQTVGSVQIRNRATLAGNICNASPAADTAPPLLVFGAALDVVGPGGDRMVLIDDLFVTSGRTSLHAGDIVRSIVVPLPPPGSGSAYTRLVRRRGTDLASVTMAARVDADQVVRLAYGSVGPRPFLVSDDSGVLVDPAAPAGEKDLVLERLLSQATPSKRSIRAGPDYRRAMLPVLARRAIKTAAERREGTPDA